MVETVKGLFGVQTSAQKKAEQAQKLAREQQQVANNRQLAAQAEDQAGAGITRRRTRNKNLFSTKYESGGLASTLGG